jgi:hypothetical protein
MKSFFNNLYGAYYSLVMKFRKINKAEIEDFQATALISALSALWVSVFFAVLQKLEVIKITYIPTYLLCIIIIVLMGVPYLYFQTNKARTNTILENYARLSKNKRRMWQIIAIAGFIVSVFLMDILL